MLEFVAPWCSTMSELEWMNYAGIIGGVVGTLTGIGGLIVSYISYRKVNRQNTRNLRLELQRARNAAHAAVSRLVELHEYAIKSRERISSAKGTLGSGAYQAWRAVAETDGCSATIWMRTQRQSG